MPLVKEKEFAKLTPAEQEYVYEHYGVNLYHTMSSPLRGDSNPSFSTYDLNGVIKWKDFSTGDGGDVYSFVMSHESTDFKSAVKLIKEILSGTHVADTKRLNYRRDSKREVITNPMYRDFELQYWAKRGITDRQLRDNEVYSLKMLLVDGRFKCTSTKDNPKFVYKLGGDSWKIYSPLETAELKWVSNNIKDVSYESKPQGLHNELVVLSSKKDKMVFDTLKLPYDTTSVLAEGNYSGIIKEIDDSLKHYRNIYCLLDFDSAGKKSTKSIEDKTSGRIKGVYLTEEMENFFAKKMVKDIDEIRIHFGSDNLLKVIKKIL